MMRLIAIVMGAVGGMVTTSEGRRLLENAYVGAPFVILRNHLRFYLDREDPSECIAQLRRTGLRFRRIDASRFPPDCPIANPVAIWLPLNEKRFLSCQLALSLHRYFQESLQDIALRDLGQRVRKLYDLGVRSCRPMTGHRFLLSEHAYANAIDVSAFELADGELIEVEEHWNEGSARERFLRDAARAACEVFHMVITPDEDEGHGNHLHFDMGRSRAVCSSIPPFR